MNNQPKSKFVNYDGRMQANLARVFGEHDADKRIQAIRELYAEDAVLNEPHDSAKGHAAINEAVTAVLASLPSGFVFSSIGTAIGHHNIGLNPGHQVQQLLSIGRLSGQLNILLLGKHQGKTVAENFMIIRNYQPDIVIHTCYKGIFTK